MNKYAYMSAADIMLGLASDRGDRKSIAKAKRRPGRAIKILALAALLGFLAASAVQADTGPVGAGDDNGRSGASRGR